jgi:ketosteroid isomerase-like protein
MSEENVEVLRRYLGTRIDALDEQALDRVMQVFHPAVEFREDPKFPEAGVYRGHDALRAYARQFSGEFDAFSWEAEDILDAGDDQVLVLLRVRGRGKGSGADVDIRGGWLFTLTEATEARVVRVDAYLDRRDALEAAGLRE